MEKNKLTADEVKEFLKTVDESFPGNTELRHGQKAMIILLDVAPTIYAEITGTDDDPFYLDERMDDFIKRISP